MRASYSSEPQFPNRNDMEEPLLWGLIRLGGSIDFSVEGRKIEIELAKEFRVSDSDRDFSSPNYKSAGNRKWRNHIQFVRDQLVKKRELDNRVRDRWTVTKAGYRRVGMPVPAAAP